MEKNALFFSLHSEVARQAKTARLAAGQCTCIATATATGLIKHSVRMLCHVLMATSRKPFLVTM